MILANVLFLLELWWNFYSLRSTIGHPSNSEIDKAGIYQYCKETQVDHFDTSNECDCEASSFLKKPGCYTGM